MIGCYGDSPKPQDSPKLWDSPFYRSRISELQKELSKCVSRVWPMSWLFTNVRLSQPNTVALSLDSLVPTLPELLVARLTLAGAVPAPPTETGLVSISLSNCWRSYILQCLWLWLVNNHTLMCYQSDSWFFQYFSRYVILCIFSHGRGMCKLRVDIEAFSLNYTSCE